MIYDKPIQLFIAYTLIYLRNELYILPSPGKLFLNVFNMNISNSFALFLSFTIIFLLPFLICFILLCCYRQQSFTLKYTLSKRYKNLINMAYYSILINTTLCILNYLESLAYSKMYYYVYRLGFYKGAFSQTMVVAYKIFMLFMMNGLIFTMIFFGIETFIAIKGNNINVGIETFIKRNLNTVIIGIIYFLMSVFIIVYFASKFYYFTSKVVVIDETNLVSDLLGLTIVNGSLGFFSICDKFFSR